MEELKGKYSKVLSGCPGKIKVIAHDIDMGDAPPVWLPFYSFPEKWTEQTIQELRTLNDYGIIEKSTSPWHSFIVPVKKPDGSVRQCIDIGG